MDIVGVDIVDTLKEFNLHTTLRAITSDSAWDMIAAMRHLTTDLEQDLLVDLSDYHVDVFVTL